MQGSFSCCFALWFQFPFGALLQRTLWCSEGRAHLPSHLPQCIINAVVLTHRCGVWQSQLGAAVPWLLPSPSVSGPAFQLVLFPHFLSCFSPRVPRQNIFFCSFPRGPWNEVPVQIIMCPEMFIPLHRDGVNSLHGFNTCLEINLHFVPG